MKVVCKLKWRGREIDIYYGPDRDGGMWWWDRFRPIGGRLWEYGWADGALPWKLAGAARVIVSDDCWERHGRKCRRKPNRNITCFKRNGLEVYVFRTRQNTFWVWTRTVASKYYKRRPGPWFKAPFKSLEKALREVGYLVDAADMVVFSKKGEARERRKAKKEGGK